MHSSTSKRWGKEYRIQGILPKEFALELVRRYKAVIAPLFDPAMKVMMFGSYAKDCPNEWSDIEPILLESGEDSPIYREVMRTGVAV